VAHVKDLFQCAISVLVSYVVCTCAIYGGLGLLLLNLRG
jgi:hypothetical protein